MIIPYDKSTYIDTSKPTFYGSTRPTTAYPFGFCITNYRDDTPRAGADRVEYIHSNLPPDLADKFLSIVNNFPATNPEYFL